MKKTRHDKHTEIETLQNEHQWHKIGMCWDVLLCYDATAVLLHIFELPPTPNLVANPWFHFKSLHTPSLSGFSYCFESSDRIGNDCVEIKDFIQLFLILTSFQFNSTHLYFWLINFGNNLFIMMFFNAACLMFSYLQMHCQHMSEGERREIFVLWRISFACCCYCP